jgi:hypothetical protein
MRMAKAGRDIMTARINPIMIAIARSNPDMIMRAPSGKWEQEKCEVADFHCCCCCLWFEFYESILSCNTREARLNRLANVAAICNSHATRWVL